MRLLSILAVLFVFGVASSSFASPKPAAASHALICPVTGEVIPSIKDAGGHSVYKGKTYYFCCSACKPLFDANPAKYVKALAKLKPKPSM